MNGAKASAKWGGFERLGHCYKARYRQTPLHYAVNRSALSMVQELVSIGADVKARDDNGDTPLHLILKNHLRLSPEFRLHVKAEHLRIIGILMDNGADIETRNSDGISAKGLLDALGIAAARSEAP